MSLAPPPLPAAVPTSILSRSWLRKLTVWIRDDLDTLVAREGAEILRSNDLLVLHNAITALHHAHNITAMDLRATGIHKAILAISGTATRWPSQLCDECDVLSSIWTAKFGPLKDLAPFVFGRGGRLEGIAAVLEDTGEALLKRWGMTCPDAIHPDRSHKQGALGFRPGAWWINSFFAHHAGIIGRESLNGGTTFDKKVVYALLLKDTVEIDVFSLEHFTHRCSRNDKGRFRLTSATPRSREPIRVLRSHSVNSAWGPKAGVRYEGLYTVKGWSIQTVKSSDRMEETWKEGDIAYDIEFERSDSVSIREVIKHPTAAEVDDYSEYKRLRKAHRDAKQQKAASPSIRSLANPNIVSIAASLKGLPSASDTAKHETSLSIGQPDDRPRPPPEMNSKNVSRADKLDHHNDRSALLAQPATKPKYQHDSELAFDDAGKLIAPKTLKKSGEEMEDSEATNMKKIAPWVGFEPELRPPTTEDQLLSSNSGATSLKSRGSSKARQWIASAHIQQKSSSHGDGKKDDRKSTFARNYAQIPEHLDGTKERKKYQRAGVLSHRTSPQADPLDGTAYESQTDDSLVSAHTERLHASPPSNKWMERFPKTSLVKKRYLTKALPRVVEEGKETLRISASQMSLHASLPLRRRISQASTTELLCDPICSPGFTAGLDNGGCESLISNLTSKVGHGKALDILVTFREPFLNTQPPTRRSRQRESSTVAPDISI